MIMKIIHFSNLATLLYTAELHVEIADNQEHVEEDKHVSAGN